MKKLFFIFYFLFFIFCTGFSQSSWFSYNPKPVASGIIDIKMIDANTIFITTNHSSFANYRGTILKSTNSGANWNIVFYDSALFVYKMFFLNLNTGYVISSASSNNAIKYLMKTTNGGTNWIKNLFPNPSVFTNALYFLNENTGFLCGSSKIYKTTNGGLNYDSINVGTYPPIYLESVSFSNSNTGYVAGKYSVYESEDTGAIYKSTDAGSNWFRIYGLQGNLNYKIQFFGDTGFCSSNNILFTTNGGLNWVQKYYWGIEDLIFINTLTGFYAGGNNVGKTTDGAATWSISSVEGAGNLTCVDAVSGNNIISAGWWGDIQRTSNGGQNWISNTFSFDEFYESSFPNPNTGYVLGSNGYYIKTTNSGDSWTRYSLFDNSQNTLSYFGIKFFTPDYGYYFNGALFTTINGGENWNKVTFANNQDITSVSFPNINTGFAFGYIWVPPYYNMPVMQKTTNAGVNWITNPVPTGSYGSVKIYFPDENTGYFVSYSNNSNYINKTTNGGLNWFILNIGTTDDIYNLLFLNNNKGFFISASKLYMTTNGGGNFITVYNDTSNRYWNARPIYFLNDNTGYFIGASNQSYLYPDRIFCTTDGGYHWTGSDAPYDVGNFQTFHFFNSNTGMIFGGKGAIIKTTNGGITFTSNNEKTTHVKYSLFQN